MRKNWPPSQQWDWPGADAAEVGIGTAVAAVGVEVGVVRAERAEVAEGATVGAVLIPV